VATNPEMLTPSEASSRDAGLSLNTTFTVVGDVDGYEKSVAGVNIEAIRTGVGFGPNHVVTTAGDGFIATAVSTRFPMMTTTTIGDDRIIAGTIVSAPPGTKWCGIELEPGAVLLYGPGALHTAMNPAGVSFAFAVASHTQIRDLALHQGMRLRPPPDGQVHLLQPNDEARGLSRTLRSTVDAAAKGVDPRWNREDDVLQAMARVIARNESDIRVGARRVIDDRRIIADCVSYAESIKRIPTMRELCMVTFVSERRLRMAFVSSFGLPPMAFFRTWGMNAARRAFIDAEPDAVTVSDVAIGCGFAHLGRFAARYRQMFGELPSETLAG